MNMVLPENCYSRSDGSIWRVIKFDGPDGSPRKRERPVCLTDLETARQKRQDFYHPVLGWIVEGVMLEKEYDTEAVLADGSVGQAIDPDQTFQGKSDLGSASPKVQE